VRNLLGVAIGRIIRPTGIIGAAPSVHLDRRFGMVLRKIIYPHRIVSVRFSRNGAVGATLLSEEPGAWRKSLQNILLAHNLLGVTRTQTRHSAIELACGTAGVINATPSIHYARNVRKLWILVGVSDSQEMEKFVFHHHLNKSGVPR
jgi:hypothetical protein